MYPSHKSHIAPPTPRSPRWYVKLGILGSCCIHLLLISLLRHRDTPPAVTTFAVEFVPASEAKKAPEPSIVAPPKTNPGEAPKTAYRSDTDNFVVREQIKRGDAPDAGQTLGERPPERASAPAQPQPKASKEPPAKKASAPPAPQPLKHLALDSSTVLREFSTPPKSEREAANDPLAAPTGEYRAFSRPRGSGAAIVGLRGSNDYLPNLPDGDLTLLNTKANRFAVFVRRVATQVFGELRRSGWENLGPGDIGRIGDYTTVLATLSRTGELIDVKLIGRSGSTRFDDVVSQAVRKGARDPHPPPGAEAADGTIRFIFQSKSWVQLSADPRGPGFGERRWILLGTGLE